MTFPRLALSAAAIVASAAMLVGCGASSGGGDGSESAGDASGGTLTYLEPQTWTTLYPPEGGFYPNGGVIGNITDRLLWQNPETLALEPWIATALPEVNDDATEYTFTIREGVTYSDGSPLDAENVVKNIDLFAKGDADRALAPSEAINNYDRGEVTGENTVTFYFTAPSPGFGQAVSTINSGLVSNETLERTGDEFGPGNATEIIGSGPFVIESEEIGTELTLVARDDYDWAPESAEHDGRALLDAIDIIVAAEDSVRVGTVVAGQADIARQIEAPDEAQFSADGLSIVAASTNGVNNGLSLRPGVPQLSDIDVRRAIILGIDRQEIVDTLFTDSYPLATGALAHTALGYIDTSEYYTYDPAEAERLLDEAGWTPGADGIREKDGERLSFQVNEALPQPRSREVITLVQQQLAKIGIDVSLFSGDQVAQNAARNDLDQIQIYHSMVGRSDYDVLKSQYSGENRNTLHNRNVETGEYVDPELEELLDAIASAPTEEGRQEASAAAQIHLAEQAYIVPFFEEPQVFGLTDAVSGFRTESVGRPWFYDVSLAE